MNNDDLPVINLNKAFNKQGIIDCPNCGKGIGKIPFCFNCDTKNYYKEYYKQNKQKFLDVANKKYKENKKECLQAMKEYAKNNKEKLKKYRKKYYQKNKEKMQTDIKINYKKNYKKYNKVAYLKKKEKMKDKNSRLYIEERLRSRIGMAIKYHKGIKACSAIKLLSANIKKVREHIEKQFKSGMTWENHGEWHIDHIIPCCKFDLKKEEEQKKCFHYTNLQPLWAKENLSKGGN